MLSRRRLRSKAGMPRRVRNFGDQENYGVFVAEICATMTQ